MQPMQSMPMNTTIVRFPLSEPDSGPGHFGDLRILRPGDGGDAGAYLDTRVFPEPTAGPLRANVPRRRRSDT